MQLTGNLLMGRPGSQRARKVGTRSTLSGGIALLALILLPAGADAAVQTAGNAFYRVHVQDAGATLGRYTVTTGPSHAQGPGVNVLFGSGVPGSSFDSIHSFDTGTDFTQGAGGSGLGTFGTVTPSPLGPGFRTTYVLPGSSGTPDSMTIVQDFFVVGSTCEDSRIVRQTSITNRNLESSQFVGIRYLWDTQIGNDDGPTFQGLSPDGPVLVNETSFVPPGFQTYRIVDNDSNPTPPTFAVLGTAGGPTTISPQPTQPTALRYVSWADASSTTFDYPPTGQNVANGTDSAVTYWWGHNRLNAIDIPPGGTATVNSQMIATPSGTCPSAPPPTPPSSQPPPDLQPIEGVRVVAEPKGTVRVRCPGEGGFRDLTATEEIAIGCTFDATNGRVTLTSSYNGTFETVTFYDGRFKLKQKEGAKPFLVADLRGELSCPRRSSKATAGDVGELSAKRKKKRRRLWGDGDGHFTTSGDGGAASARGTKWFTSDRCDRETLFRVRKGKVVIDDFSIPGRKNRVLRPGKTYVTKG